MEQQTAQTHIQRKWHRSITFGELMTASIIMVSSMLMFWKTTDVRLSALEIRMFERERQEEKIIQKLDHVAEGINDVKVALQNKEDRQESNHTIGR